METFRRPDARSIDHVAPVSRDLAEMVERDTNVLSDGDVRHAPKSTQPRS